jgi:hypothetical protein
MPHGIFSIDQHGDIIGCFKYMMRIQFISSKKIINFFISLSIGN